MRIYDKDNDDASDNGKTMRRRKMIMTECSEIMIVYRTEKTSIVSNDEIMIIVKTE